MVNLIQSNDTNELKLFYLSRNLPLQRLIQNEKCYNIITEERENKNKNQTKTAKTKRLLTPKETSTKITTGQK